MAPEIGRKYGPYEVLSRLGGGGMGHVYKAWDARLHREVAIKLLHNEYAMPGMRERFLREARAASALNHPNICTIFDIGEQNGDPYLVMELLQGETLRDRIQYHTLQVDDLICIAREVAEALGAAHAKGVIHRDIKPANIFLVDKANKAVQAKVLDFGLAKFEGGTFGGRGSRSLDLTAAGATVGTLAYMSPEQARGESLDSRSDLFSLGVVMYEMATRQIPFPGATSALVFVKLLNQAPEPVRDWNEAIPRELEKIILKLMAKERTARFQTAQELDDALARLNEKGGGWLRKAVSTVPLVRAPDPVARERRVSRRRNTEADPDAPGAPPVQLVTPPPSTPAQMLRPVARVPRDESAIKPVAGSAAGESTLSVSPIPAARAESAASPNGAPSTHASADAARPGTEPGVLGAISAAGEAERFRPTAGFQAASPLASNGSATDLADPASDAFDPGLNGFGEPSAVSSPAVRARLNRRRRILEIALTLGAIGGAWLLYYEGHYGSTLLGEHDPIVVTEIENRTSEKALDDTVTEDLQIALSESPFLRLRSSSDYRLLRRQIAPDAGVISAQIISHKVAEKLGTRAYLFGSISGSAPPYLLHVDLLNTSNNDVLTSADEHIATLDALPATVDHLASTLRSSFGERSESINRNSTPLAREGTSNLAALEQYIRGDQATADGDLITAIGSFRQAVALDPRFVRAHLRLAVLYRRERAEAAASDSAQAANAAAGDVSTRTRTMAQYEYEMNASGDYSKAATIIKSITSADPHDSEALDDLSRTLRLQGRVGEALQLAQQAASEDPYNTDAYTQAQNALIGLDRYEAAAQVEVQFEKLGLGRLGAGLTTAYLEGRQDALQAAIKDFEAEKGFHPDWSYGLYLDNVGHLAKGAAVWRTRAQDARAVPGLDSAAAFLLSQGAVNRALLGDCADSLAMAHEAEAHQLGITALFNTGLSYALCGDSARAQQAMSLLQQRYPQSFAVRSFYLADIGAALALHNNDPASALALLGPARQYDLISVTPVLRGRANVALKRVQVGIVDFQTVLSHRGLPFIVGSVVYPVAQIGVARAFADTGDAGNSAEAYRRFLNLWKDADPRQPLLVEAQAHSR